MRLWDLRVQSSQVSVTVALVSRQIWKMIIWAMMRIRVMITIRVEKKLCDDDIMLGRSA